MTDVLDRARIASPCPASWDAMKGDDRVRSCALCKLNVYDLSNMSREDAIALISKGDGRLCARLWRRKDGTVITADCPVGIATRARRRLKVLAAALAALVMAGLAGNAFAQTEPGRRIVRTVERWFDPEPEHVVGRLRGP